MLQQSGKSLATFTNSITPFAWLGICLAARRSSAQRSSVCPPAWAACLPCMAVAPAAALLVDGHDAQDSIGHTIVAAAIGMVCVLLLVCHTYTLRENRRLRRLISEDKKLLSAARGEPAEPTQQLEVRVSQRTAELRAADASLREAADRLRCLDQIRTQFVSNVSHELRTPLSNIHLYLSLLEDGKPEKRAQYMETLWREANLMQRLIEDLLDLSRLDAGRAEIGPAAVSLAPLVEATVTGRAALAAEGGLQLEVEIQPDLPPVQGNAGMLAQVLANLIANAINYTPAGGRITVSLLARHVEEREWVTLSVADTGLGIVPDEQDRLFERFFRGSAARASGAPGTGLGLAICDEILKRHGGHITVESTPGQGSTFTAWLPIETPAEQPGLPAGLPADQAIGVQH